MASSSSSLAEWRKKLTKTRATSITADEWTTVFELLTSSIGSQPTLDLLALLLVALRQLAYIFFVDPDENHDELTALIHDRLVPSLQRPEIGTASLARLLVDGLQDPSKPLQSRAIDCLCSASKLALVLPAPTTSSSKAAPPIVPLFRYLINQGADQKWTLSALANILPAIPIGEVPDNVFHKLLQEMDVSDNIAIRSTVIVEILKARWSAHIASDDGTEQDFHRIMYRPVLSLFNPSTASSQTWQNVQRYLYPALSTVKSPSGRGFLHYLETLPSDSAFPIDAQLECWVSIASAAVQAKTLGIRDIDETRLSQAACHASATVRLKAFIICSQNEDLLYEKNIKALKSAFEYNSSLHGQGERSEFASAVYNLFTHLDQETHAARRAAQRVAEGHKAIKGFEVKSETDGMPCPRQTILLDPNRAIDVAEDFRHYVLKFWIRPGLASARRHPVAKALVSLIVMKLYLDIFGSEEGMHDEVFTRDTVQELVACQASEFTDVRRRARAILDMARVPLPGYDSVDTPDAHALRASATASLAHPRKTQAEAGRSALCVLFTKLVLGSEHETRFVGDLVDRLDEHLLACERDLSTGIEQKPLHGLLAAIRDLVYCLDLSSRASRIAWRPVFERLLRVVDRVWGVTRPVISLKATGQSGSESRPDHEIARAYEVANAGDMGAEDDDQEGTSDVTGLLSGCWRATTGAGDLLSSIISVALIGTQIDEEAIWSREDVDAAGERFLTWMHEVRHRGTFSKIAIAFASLVQSVKSVSALTDLPLAWLERELSIVRGDTLSTTRRSAALPYSILSIITDDADLTDRAISSLIGMADVNSSTSDITKVHAFNVLQVSLPDAKQARFLDRYFEQAVMTAIGAFESPNWNVRNVGLILFSTLINRSLHLGKSHDWLEYRSPSATRQTYSAWHAKYPLLLPHITTYLKHYDLSATASQHSPLFPMLIIIRSLRASDTGHSLQESLVPAVERFLGSREWQVRRVAAQALSSLLSHKQALFRATNWDVSTHTTSSNELHGRLQLLTRLIEDVIDWSKVDNLSKRQVERNLSLLLDRHGDSRLSDIFNTVVQCAGSYINRSESTNTALIDSTTRVAERVLLAPEVAGRPTHGMQMWLSAAFLLGHRPGKDTILRMLAFTNASPHVQQCPALWALQGMMGPAYDEYLDHDVFPHVLALARSRVHDDAVRISAMSALRDIVWPQEVLDGVGQETREGFVRDMLCAVRRTKYVPIREAALPALAWGVSWLSGVEARDGKAAFEALGVEVLKSSHEDQSLPSRESSLAALKLLESRLFPESATTAAPSAPRPGDLLVLHQTLDRLLHDDDSDLRQGACEIVRSGLRHLTPICHEKANWLWREWLAGYIRTLDDAAARSWQQWLVDQIIDRDGIEADSRALTAPAHQPDVLFEVEPSNLFRDPLADAEVTIGLRVIARMRGGSFEHLTSLELVKRVLAARDQIDALLQTSSMESSPIDDSWEARRVLLVRKETLSRWLRTM